MPRTLGFCSVDMLTDSVLSRKVTKKGLRGDLGMKERGRQVCLGKSSEINSLLVRAGGRVGLGGSGEQKKNCCGSGKGDSFLERDFPGPGARSTQAGMARRLTRCGPGACEDFFPWQQWPCVASVPQARTPLWPGAPELPVHPEVPFTCALLGSQVPDTPDPTYMVPLVFFFFLPWA